MAPRVTKPVDPQRQLMIKTKTCQRLIKESEYYKKEVTENEAKLAEMKSQGRDPYDIKKFEEVLGESHMMVPDSARRLNQALDDLFEFCQQPGLQEQGNSEWYETAQQILATYGKQNDLVDGAPSTNVDDLAEGEDF